MSRQVPIRYRAESCDSGQGYVCTKGGATIAYCDDSADAVMIADALNRANEARPADPSPEEVNARRAARGLDPIEPELLERARRNARAMTRPKEPPSIGERLHALEEWRREAEALANRLREPIDRAIPPGAIFPRDEEDGA